MYLSYYYYYIAAGCADFQAACDVQMLKNAHLHRFPLFLSYRIWTCFQHTACLFQYRLRTDFRDRVAFFHTASGLIFKPVRYGNDRTVPRCLYLNIAHLNQRSHLPRQLITRQCTALTVRCSSFAVLSSVSPLR